MANDTERSRWNDESWAGTWPKRERLTDRVTPYVLEAAALQPGERVLEIGSGGGKASLAAAEAVGTDGRVVGVDLSTPLVALARQRAEAAGAGNLTFAVADAQTDSLGDHDFDVAVSQFGVMFFEDPVAAFGNIRSHLRAAGRLAFACWRSMEENTWFPGRTVAPFVAPAPPPDPERPTGPFAFGEAERVTGILTSAGFDEVRRIPHDLTAVAPADALMDEDQLRFLGVRPADMPAALEAVAQHLSRFRQLDDGYELHLAFHVFTATSTP